MKTNRLSLFFIGLAPLLILAVLLSSCAQGVVSTSAPTQMSTIQSGGTEPESNESAEANLTQFGLLTVLPESTGATFSPQVVAAIKSTGVRYMRVSLDWAISEPKQGQISFTTNNDKMIQDIENAGLRVFPTLYVGSGWMNGSPVGRQAGGSRSYPPDDLSKQWSDQYGYSQSYYNFVSTFFTHYRGHFDYVAIENEANSMIFWGGTADDYVRLLKTAYKAIKAADPQVTVVDSGFVSNAIGYCIANDYLKSGKSANDVLQFVTEYYIYDHTVTQVSTTGQLEKTINQSTVQEQCQRIDYMLNNMGGSIDAINFHFYENYQALPAVVAWLRQKTAAAGYNPAVVSNEMGVRTQGGNFAQSTTHAIELVKDLVTAMSMNLKAVVWFSADTTQTGKDKVGIFDSNGQLRPAGVAMKFLNDTMKSVKQFDKATSTGPNLYQYIFEDANDVPFLEVVWVEGAQQSIKLQAPQGDTQAMVSDYAGKSNTLTVQSGSITLPSGDDPAFVSWK